MSAWFLDSELSTCLKTIACTKIKLFEISLHTHSGLGNETVYECKIQFISSSTKVCALNITR